MFFEVIYEELLEFSDRKLERIIEHFLLHVIDDKKYINRNCKKVNIKRKKCGDI